MRFGTGIFLLALGAILAFAVQADLPYISLDVAGYVLMACGVVGIIWAISASQRRRVSETRVAQDPTSGEQVTRSETHDGM